MARQGEIREGEIPPFEDDAPRQDAPHIPEGSQQDRPAEEEGSHGFGAGYVSSAFLSPTHGAVFCFPAPVPWPRPERRETERVRSGDEEARGLESGGS